MTHSIEVSEEKGVRYLHFGSELVQGAMRIARPHALELVYTRELMLPLLLADDSGWPRTVLQIGMGAASVTKFLHRQRPRARITVVEIDPRVVETAREFFRLPDESERLRIVIGDGHEFLGGHRGRFDLIIVDGFDEKGRTGSLDTAAFYAVAHAHLAAGGMVSANLLTRRRGIAASEERMRQVFAERVLVLPPPEAGNTVAILGAALPLESLDDLRARATVLREDTGLNLLPTLARIAGNRRDAFRLHRESAHPR